jgi:hypothetical protein
MKHSLEKEASNRRYKPFPIFSILIEDILILKGTLVVSEVWHFILNNEVLRKASNQAYCYLTKGWNLENLYV